MSDMNLSLHQISQWLSPAKIDFACSAHYYDHVSAVNLSAEQQAMLNEITDPTFKESVRDFMVNQQFRRDYWVKGPRKLSATEQTELLNQHKLVLLISWMYLVNIPGLFLKIKHFNRYKLDLEVYSAVATVSKILM